VDAGSAEVGDLAVGALTTRLSYPYGISVNARGERFVDEGADFKLLTYAKVGRDILAQPHGVAYQVFDQQTVPLLEPRYGLGSAPYVADSIEGLARAIGIPPEAFAGTVAAYNDSLGGGDFNPAIRDGLSSRGITPPKSNWSLPLEVPPYVAYAVSCAITFTYGGLQIDPEARVISSGGIPIPGLFAAGEITGAFFYDNYPAGAGLVRGTVFGRIAGRNAAGRARELEQ
jgi:tricarballylate dehydrogenase